MRDKDGHRYMHGAPKGGWPVFKKVLICQECGTTKGVEEGIDPYMDELYDEQVPMTACSSCFSDRAWEI